MNHSTTIPHKTLPGRNTTQPAVPPLDPSRSWLEHFPPPRRSGIANWFHTAVRAGHCTPWAVVQQVISTTQQRLLWAYNNEETGRFRHVLACLDMDQLGALAYAATVIAGEGLPRDERARQKSARATHYQQQHMTQLPVTPKQVSFLHMLGYTGELPANRADASTVIDGLLTANRKGQP